ncbi:hypothetical protein MJG53_006487 [Ovis ammon polii x Ovis aries]|uniref:Uncharacterized protein n=2 Tax=Ovis TaxID=9935 RepID=A0A836D6E1_SHEEP|nr:hypothetical protein JEQ12_015592 [Ovis aries]KAI4570503.1 hypothetical protein MJT46_006020 [Ovis ammon polii x Ovis aries]KAI4584953.1 hypothetical protein MJG53_006487 [Ovis ammon polii x Ovis aries]
MLCVALQLFNCACYVCRLVIQIVNFRPRSVQTTSSQNSLKNGYLRVKLTLGLPQNSKGESRLSLGSNEESQELASEAPRCKAPVAAPHPQA